MWNMAGDPSHYIAPGEWNLRLGELQFVHIMAIPFGERFAARLNGEPCGTVADVADSALHYVHVIWQLMCAEITAQTRRRADRSTRRRIRKSVRHDLVTVVTLRRARTREGTGPETPLNHVDWTCRWLVSGHWRHVESYTTQHHRPICDTGTPGEPRCITCGARITWIRPFIKGPEDKPFRRTEILHRLSR
jgi:hypothetical protein